MNKKSIITALLTLFALVASAAVPDSIRQNLADFDSVVYMAEHDYAPFKFKVTNKNKKEYNALKKRQASLTIPSAPSPRKRLSSSTIVWPVQESNWSWMPAWPASAQKSMVATIPWAASIRATVLTLHPQAEV